MKPVKKKDIEAWLDKLSVRDMKTVVMNAIMEGIHADSFRVDWGEEDSTVITDIYYESSGESLTTR